MKSVSRDLPQYSKKPTVSLSKSITLSKKPSKEFLLAERAYEAYYNAQLKTDFPEFSDLKVATQKAWIAVVDELKRNYD